MSRLCALAFGLLLACSSRVSAQFYSLDGEEINVVVNTASNSVTTTNVVTSATPAVFYFGSGASQPSLSIYASGQFTITFPAGSKVTTNADVAELSFSLVDQDFPSFIGFTPPSLTPDQPKYTNKYLTPAYTPIVSVVGGDILINLQQATYSGSDTLTYNWGIVAQIVGDPQFTGFMGQSYQVHGISGNVYNIISTPSFQYNALFSYLDSGRSRKGTQAFSHPGNYFGAVGVKIKDSTGAKHQLLIQSGAVDTGLTLQYNNQTMVPSDHVLQIGAYEVSMPNQFEVVFESAEFNIRVQNSDFFFNQAIAIGTTLMNQIAQYKRAVKAGDSNVAELKAVLPHGILGQTWDVTTYDNRWKHIQGHLFEYQLVGGLFDDEFSYNKF